MNIRETFHYTEELLERAGIENPAFDTIYLFEHIFSLSRKDTIVYADKAIDESKLPYLNECITRRISGEPIQYIIGQWEFMGNTYKVAQGVLIPRDDTEVLVTTCLDILNSKKECQVVDLCSGSGIIAITLKLLSNDITVYAVEKSDTAYSYLVKNAILNNADIKHIHADLYDCVNEFEDSSLDLIVSNPPYIISHEIKTLQKEVQFEPALALDGGKDGYDFYRGIINVWSKKLKKGGIIAFEIGENQFEYIKTLLENAGYTDVEGFLDIAGTVRAMTAIYNP
ncbi:MAG: peptide chain release factor N(5)-glutamine methyltransferase [Ruminococcus sp.]|nr:peptide chain release factor N(5)-glutamine methyltransferase [Ruminococcus sp.]